MKDDVLNNGVINLGYFTATVEGVYMKHDGTRYGPFKSADEAVGIRLGGIAMQRLLGFTPETIGEAYRARPAVRTFDPRNPNFTQADDPAPTAPGSDTPQ